MSEAPTAHEPIPRGVWIGAMVVLVGVFVRAVCPAEPFPYWDADPFRFAPPITGLTPTRALALDLVIILGGVLTVARSAKGIGNAPSVLLAIGFTGLCYHALTNPEAALDSADIGASLAAMACAWAAGRHAPIRRVMVGTALGFGAVLAAVGAVQVFIEHPATLASFEMTKGEFYSSRGWDPGGPKAAMYEERLSHADPSGAFGLTNVFATFAGASAAGLIACAVAPGWSLARRLLLVAGAGVGAWALIATGSKGGIGAAALAALTVLVARRVRPGWVGRAVLFAAIGVVVAVAVRGLFGDTFDERSLLFRSHYQQGTASVFMETPLVGTGPGQFQEAYTRLKPADAPEDVTSPHSVWFDWLGTLGVAGITLIGATVLGWWRRERDPADPDGPCPDARVMARLACIAPACALLAATMIQRETMIPERSIAIIAGCVAWCVIAATVAAAGNSLRTAALVIGAVALVHGQLDVAPIWTVSAPAWGLLVGCGLGALSLPEQPGRLRWTLVVAGVALAGACGWHGVSVAQWQSALVDAARVPARIGRLRTEIIVAGPGMRESDLRSIAAEVDGWLALRSPTPPRVDAVLDRLDAASLLSLDPAAERLRAAVEARPTHHPTRVALCRVLGMIASRDAIADPGSARRALDETVSAAEAGTEIAPESAAAWAWLGNTCQQRAAWADRLAPGAEPVLWRRRAVGALERTAALNPHDPEPAASAAEILAELGEDAEAGIWARRAIGLDDLLALDPKRRLNPGRRAALERLAQPDG